MSIDIPNMKLQFCTRLQMMQTRSAFTDCVFCFCLPNSLATSPTELTAASIRRLLELYNAKPQQASSAMLGSEDSVLRQILHVLHPRILQTHHARRLESQ